MKVLWLWSRAKLHHAGIGIQGIWAVSVYTNQQKRKRSAVQRHQSWLHSEEPESREQHSCACRQAAIRANYQHFCHAEASHQSAPSLWSLGPFQSPVYEEIQIILPHCLILIYYFTTVFPHLTPLPFLITNVIISILLFTFKNNQWSRWMVSGLLLIPMKLHYRYIQLLIISWRQSLFKIYHLTSS